MITLKDSIKIKASPQNVYDKVLAYLHDRESYISWHPGHIELRWIKGDPCKEGSIVCAEEYIGNDLQKLKFKIVKVVPGRQIIYRPLFPQSMFAPGNTWLFQPKGENGCIFTAIGRLRGGPLMKKLAVSRLKTLALHMEEEGKNLKKVLETDRQKA